jgi:hypothetical protein|uniref:hypothetical protein n=1 Tax=Eshraghiella crossota TaxID=45851 RepID=UPI004027B1E0
MLNTRLVSDLENYSDISKKVDESDSMKSAYMLFDKLKKAEDLAEKEGWIDADEIEKELVV